MMRLGSKNPPRKGEGDRPAGVVEGASLLTQPTARRRAPSTMLRMVPLPVPGKI